MIPSSFDYHAPTSVDEAIALLGQLDDAKVLAGMKQGSQPAGAPRAEVRPLVMSMRYAHEHVRCA